MLGLVMPVEETTDPIVEALKALDERALQAVGDRAGFSVRTLYRYRAGQPIPRIRRHLLERELGLSSSSRSRDPEPSL